MQSYKITRKNLVLLISKIEKLQIKLKFSPVQVKNFEQYGEEFEYLM
jgi:hypothetical protein